jgi:hypothetical protein
MTTSSSATAVAVAHTAPQRAWTLSGPLDPALYYPKSGPLPGVVRVTNQTGPWDTIGQTRTLNLSDGSSVVETITDADSPEFFAYNLSDFTKLFGGLVSGARAEWRFEPEGTGTSIRWTYTFHGKPGRGWIVAIIVRLFWAGYMARVLPPIAEAVESAPD